MSNGDFSTGDDNGGLDVGAIGNLGVLLGEAVGKKQRKPFNPFGAAKKSLRFQAMIDTTEAKIAEDVRLGNPISDADLKRLATLNERLERQERKFKKQVAKKPKRFIKAGIAAGTTLAQLAAAIAGGPRGQKIISQFSSPVFNPPALPGTGGTSTMPFVVTPAASEEDTFGGFGDIISSVIRAGGQIGSALLGPKTVAFGGPQQAALVPFGSAVGPALKQLPKVLGGLGLGAAGGELVDLFQGGDRFTGGAGTLDDTAAFTDPIPGSCRPKEHVKINPCTGRGTWFTPRGRPLVFSGDLAACKRVDRVAKRLGKSRPKARRTCAKRKR